MNASLPPPDEAAPPRRARAAYTEEDDRAAGLIGFRPALAVRPGVCFAYADRWRGAAVAAIGFAGSFVVPALALFLRHTGWAVTSERTLDAVFAVFIGWAWASLVSLSGQLGNNLTPVLLLCLGVLAVQWGWGYALARSVRRLTGWRGWPWFAAAPLVLNGIAYAFSFGDTPFLRIAGRVPTPYRAAAWSALGLLLVLEIVGRILRRRAGPVRAVAANASSARGDSAGEGRRERP